MRWMTTAFVLQGILAAAASADDRRVVKYVPEEQGQGDIVANMARIFSLRYNERAERTFKLLSQSLITENPPSEKQDVDLLLLNTDTGVITTSQNLDREELCESAEKCIIRVQAVMLPNEFFTMLDMDVLIEDDNDNSPTFSNRNIRVSFAEGDVSVGDVISLDKYRATDRDTGANGEISYDLEDNPYFAAETYQDDSGVPHLRLKALAEPDHEETSSLELTLTATDGGEEALSDRAILTINVVDSNDNDPIFDQQEYFVRLRENDDRPHIVATVHAEDKDSGDFGSVRYRLPEPAAGDRAANLAQGLLSINELTGEVTLKRKVDRETHDGLRVRIEAVDSDPEKPRTGTTKLVIHVEDVNDNAPVIKVKFIVDSTDITGYIPESASIKTYVAYVSASDVDNGENGKVTTQITTFGKHKSQTDLIELTEQFFLAPDGLLATGRPLDRETFQYFVIWIKSCDLGSPAKCASRNITVVVLDINDNPPVFDSPAKSVMIREDEKVGSFIVGVRAEDEDAKFSPSMWKSRDGKIEESRNGIVRYSIIQGDTTFFEIDEASGDVSLKKSLDHETQQEWKLIIEARDGGWQTYFNANCSINIRVGDVNDNSPVFIRPSGDNEEVKATILRDQVVTTIEALDSDAGSNSRISYKILKQDSRLIISNKTTSGFILNPNTGDLRLNFSRSNLTNFLGRHTVVIEARDSGDPPKSATVLMYVTVINELLPDPVNVAGFDEKYILLAVTLCAASLVLVITIVVIMFCRRRKDKKLRTYNCRSAEKKSNAWISPSMNMDGSKPVESRYYHTNTFGSSASTSPKKLRQPSARNDAIAPQEQSSAVDQSKMTTFTSESKPAPTTVVLSALRAPDRDSGRGDSDSETGNFASADDTAAHNGFMHRRDGHGSQLQGSQNDNESTTTSKLGPQCDENCRTQGHSDNCWMPSPASDNYSRWSRTRSYKSPIASASAPRLDVPNYYDYDSSARWTNEYPTLHNYPSAGRYSPLPESYATLSLRRPIDQYYRGREGDLAPIEESALLNDPGDYADQEYEGDDVSAHTQMTLSTTSPRRPHENNVADAYVRSMSRASNASSQYPQTSLQSHSAWDTPFLNPPRYQRLPPIQNNYVEFTPDYRPPTSPIPRVTYPRKSSSSSEQSSRWAPQFSRRPESAKPYEAVPTYGNLDYYYGNGSLQNIGTQSVQKS